MIAVGSPGTPPPKGRGRSIVSPVTGLGDVSALSRGDASSGLVPGRVWAVIVRLWDSDGHFGIGSVGFGNASAVGIIKEQFAPLVINQNPFDVEILWERMFRSTINIGRKGIVIEAISAVDIALWDLKGQILQRPLYELLGGRTKERIPVYASRLYATEDLDALGMEARSYVEQGFTGVKQRMAYGPYDGLVGMRKNLELVQTVSRAIGPDVEHMVDAYMGWDVGYAVRMIHLIENAGIRLRWVEEPVIPDDVQGYAKIRRSVSTPISGGEHEFTRYGALSLLQADAVDVLQVDVNRVGGVTEAQKVWALASAFGIPVIPHVGQMHNYHLIMSHLNSPMAEHIIRPEPGVVPDEDELFYRLFDGEPDAVDGFVDLDSTRPGLGLTLNDEVLGSLRIDI